MGPWLPYLRKKILEGTLIACFVSLCFTALAVFLHETKIRVQCGSMMWSVLKVGDIRHQPLIDSFSSSGGFLKSGFPQIIQFYLDVPIINFINHLFWGTSILGGGFHTWWYPTYMDGFSRWKYHPSRNGGLKWDYPPFFQETSINII